MTTTNTTATEIVLTVFFSLFWLVAVAGHVVLLKFLLTPYERVKLRLPPGSWLLLLSITVADFVALLVALPFTSLFAIFDNWFFGLLICNLSTYLKIASLTVSSYMILGLLMQCYEMVVKTHRPRTSTAKLALLLGSIWLLALATSYPMLISHEMIEIEDDIQENLETFSIEERDFNLTQKAQDAARTVAEKRTYCVPKYRQESMFYEAAYLYLQFIFPVAIVIFLFIKITDTMNKAVGKNTKNSTVELAQQPDVIQLPQDVKFVRTILILAVVFHLFWAPTNFFTVFFHSKSVIWIFIVALSESTFFIKPLIYFAVNTNFQNALRTMGIPTTDVEDVDGYQVGFSKMEEVGVY